MKKKTEIVRKNTRQAGKNTGKTVKKTGKRGKPGSDAIRAFLLTAAVVIFSLLISAAVISIHSSLKKPSSPLVPDADILLPIAEDNTPVENVDSTRINSKSVTVIVDSPSTNKTLKPVDTTGAVQTQKSVDTSPAVQKPVNITDAVQTKEPVNTTPVVQMRPENSKTLGALVFIIDDAGNNLRELDPFLRISYPFAIAVLPGLPYSAEAARRIRAAGKEVFLHQPMEAINGQSPGPGAIYSGMTDDEIRAILKRNIAEIGPVAGMNNHQGSKITMNINMMETILSFCAEEKIIFVDSRTTAGTEVPAAARKLGIKIQERDVFLDNEQDKASMLRYISTGLERARKNGKAVMIGHAWSPELAPLLAEEFPKLKEQGYSLSTPSDIP
ncbi:MAG: divergent polysaccharide deacetylase family protein [Treponema sp.]|jgi:polysaccharide deacetylase 2 family uncharacterized protein YibQ|nr:divergent polysaccharide deacetylase family protein [Treponema sp.]